MSPAPDSILRLVDQFAQHRDAYTAGAYNEENLRSEFIDPFFEALGWDVYNRSNAAEAYKDLVREESMRAGAPDYCFRIGGTPKFFVEAKKPSVDIADAPAPAFQLRRYAWSAHLPLSILTDFEEFAVYDCRIPPKNTDPSRTARRDFLTFDHYPDRWDFISSVFSRAAVLQGGFDTYTQSHKGRGADTVDRAFLKEIESWRDLLAHNIANRNPGIQSRDLNFAVQRTIDRIIFLRMAEDRSVEPVGRLQSLLNGPDTYSRLLVFFREADDRYNSGLFHFSPERDRLESPDTLTPSLKIDDKALKDVIRSLYYPASPYEFSVLPPDILGNVYEQFLGKVIHLTTGGHARIEDKPEVKKAGGVYYTPKYIVDYIVTQTVGRLLGLPPTPSPLTGEDVAPKRGATGEGVSVSRNPESGIRTANLTPKQISKIRIVDPACGSGSFLVGAYRWLLDYHRDWYLSDGPAKHTKELYQGHAGQWFLSTPEKKRILVNNIFGVDIDPQAVEVTKLNLLLCVLENENTSSLRQLALIHQRALPDLGHNIKCGNSLIAPDFYRESQLDLFDDETRYRINAFDWSAEFPQIMKSGGFDAVIGNPPYVRQEALSDFKEYFQRHYEAFDGVADLYAYFMEKALKLLRDGGLFSFIVSSSFLRATYGEPLRRTLKKHAAVLRIVDFGGLAVFEKAKDTYVCIPLLAKGAKQEPVLVSIVDSLAIQNLSEHVSANHFAIPQERLSPEAWSLKSDEESAVLAKLINAGQPLGDYVNRHMFYGIKTGLNAAFEISASQRSALLLSTPSGNGLIKPFLGGQDIRRYSIEESERYLIVIPCGWTRQQMLAMKKASTDFSQREAWNWFSREYKNIAEHLDNFSDALRKRQDQGDYWWELRPCDYYKYLDTPKIIFPDICKGPRFYVDRTGMYLSNTAYCLGTDDLYLLGILNSRLFWFAISNISIPFGTRAGKFRYRLIYQYMEKVPIRVINFSDPTDKTRHDKMVQLVQRMLDLHKNLAAANSPHDQTVLQRQISSTDSLIDSLVYQLYGLTEQEIKIVEEQ